MNNYKDLKVWKKAISMTTKVYSVVDSFPDKERFGLTSQITRSAVSVAFNIAEGSGRNSSKEFYQFLGIALGSCFE
jgi:four helix bundle protein